jgi:hypothetical protein
MEGGQTIAEMAQAEKIMRAAFRVVRRARYVKGLASQNTMVIILFEKREQIDDVCWFDLAQDKESCRNVLTQGGKTNLQTKTNLTLLKISRARNKKPNC